MLLRVSVSKCLRIKYILFLLYQRIFLVLKILGLKQRSKEKQNLFYAIDFLPYGNVTLDLVAHGSR